MKKSLRRQFIKNGIAAAVATAVAPAVLPASVGVSTRDNADSAVSDSGYEIRTEATAPWVPIRVVDTGKMSWKQTDIFSTKALFSNTDKKGNLGILQIPPRHHDWLAHYHTHHEWALILAGDLVNCEYTSPDQKIGPLMRYKEGYFLDRPPYCIHGYEEGRHLESQMGATILLMGEGNHSVSAIPGHPVYSEEWRTVKVWGRPRIIDTINKMPWEPEGKVPDLHVKCLADDQGRGFRAVLRWLPAGWKGSIGGQFAGAYYYKQAYQFNFVVTGDLSIQTYKSPKDRGQKVSLGRYFYLERAPMGIFGLSDGIATEGGCVWLEVTYARGTSVSDNPIEEPVFV